MQTVISSLEFHATFFTLSSQLTFGVVLCLAFKPFQHLLPGFHVPDINWGLVKRAIPVGALFMANNASAFIGIRLVPAPLFLAVRRTAIGLIMLTEWGVLGKRPTGATVLSILLVVLGALVAGWDSIQSGADAVGFAYIIFSNCLAALSLTYARKFSDDTGVRGLGLVMYTGLTGAPIGWVLGVWAGEMDTVAAYPSLFTAPFLGGILLYCMLGTAMNYTQNLCSLYNSPLVSAVVGVLKDVVSTLVSAVVFSGYDATVQSVVGLVLSFVGASAFSYVKLTSPEQQPAGKQVVGVLPDGPTGSAPHLTPPNSPQCGEVGPPAHVSALEAGTAHSSPTHNEMQGSTGVPAAINTGGIMPTAGHWGAQTRSSEGGYSPPHSDVDEDDGGPMDAAEQRPLLGGGHGGVGGVESDHALDRHGPASPLLGGIAASTVGAVSKRLASLVA